MTTLIGLYQANTTENPLPELQHPLPGQLVSAGPFATLNQALAWQHYMQKRCNCGALPIKETATQTKPSPWFGYTIKR